MTQGWARLMWTELRLSWKRSKATLCSIPTSFWVAKTWRRPWEPKKNFCRTSCGRDVNRDVTTTLLINKNNSNCKFTWRIFSYLHDWVDFTRILIFMILKRKHIFCSFIFDSRETLWYSDDPCPFFVVKTSCFWYDNYYILFMWNTFYFIYSFFSLVVLLILNILFKNFQVFFTKFHF